MQNSVDVAEQNGMPRRSQRILLRKTKLSAPTGEGTTVPSNETNGEMSPRRSKRLSERSALAAVVPKKNQPNKRKSKVEDKLQKKQAKPKVTQKKSTPKVTKEKSKSRVVKKNSTPKIPQNKPKPTRRNNKRDVNGNQKTTPTDLSNDNASESFRKYGIVVPTVDEIRDKMIEARAKIEKMKSLYNDMKERYADFDDSIESIVDVVPSESPVENIVLLDCKHLDKEQLNRYFTDNLQYLKDISNGIVHSKRHEKFFVNSSMSCFSYAPEMCMFTSNQVQQLATTLEENVTLGNKDSSYYFKVLLPETCLKIFMDVHDKTMEEAKAYIEWRPID